MQIKPIHRSGSVLLPVLFIVVLAAIVIGAASALTSEQTLLSSRSADVDSMQTTGEGLLDYAFAQWKTLLKSTPDADSSALNAVVSGSNRPAVPTRMELVSLTLNPVDLNGTAKSSRVETKDYSGTTVYNYLASATLRTASIAGVRTVTVRRNFIYDKIPPYKNMFFTNGNFELYKLARMVIGGDVHTNGDAHVSTDWSSDNLTFLSNARVSYVGAYDNETPTGASNWSSDGTNYAPYYESGVTAQVKRVPEVTGIGEGTAAEYNTTDANPNNDGNRELIEPPVAGYEDPKNIAQSRLYNQAGLLITVSGPIDNTATLSSNGSTYSGGNLTIKAQNGTSLSSSQAVSIRAAISNSTTTQVTTWVPKLVTVTSQVWVESGYWSGTGRNRKWINTSHYETRTETVDQGSYVTTNVLVQNTIYDKRELQSVPISNLDVGAVRSTLNGLSNFNGVIYMYDNGAGDKKAIRVTNGGNLPTNGLTVATEGGLYVQGDYNTGTVLGQSNLVPSNANPSATAATSLTGYTTKNASLVGDAIMILSNGWTDSNASAEVGSRPALNTTLNAVLIGGYVASVDGGDSGRSGYSGGMNNFPRLLENWSDDSLTFSGAFVSLYQSQRYTGQWDTGDIYVPPTRYWTFDRALLTNLIPGIKPASVFVRGAMIKI